MAQGRPRGKKKERQVLKQLQNASNSPLSTTKRSTSILNHDSIYLDTDLNSLNLSCLNKIERLIISYTYGLNNKPELIKCR